MDVIKNTVIKNHTINIRGSVHVFLVFTGKDLSTYVHNTVYEELMSSQAKEDIICASQPILQGQH